SFGDAIGVQPTLAWPQLQALGVNDGPHSFNVKVQVDDGHGHTVTSTAASLTVANATPTALLSNSGPALDGDPASARFTNASDPSAADTAAGFHYAFNIDPAQLALATYANSGTMASAPFTFSQAGSYTVYGRIIDNDNGYLQTSTVVTINF